MERGRLPPQPTRGSGKRRKLHQRVPGRAPAEDSFVQIKHRRTLVGEVELLKIIEKSRQKKYR